MYLLIKKFIIKFTFNHPLRFFLAFISLALIRITDQIKAAERPKNSNILLILCDDMGFSDIGCYGGEINTPNIDNLAQQGVRFTQFYNVAKCSPTRASLLSGLYHQQTEYRLKKATSNVTVAEVLRSAGYATLISGKWHLGDFRKETGTPLERGFDRYFGFLCGCINHFTGVWKNENYMRLNEEIYHPPDDFYSTDYFTDYAIRFIQEVERDKPFFLYLAYDAPHYPLQVPSEDIQKYLGRYMIGWDKLRQKRYERLINIKIIKPEWRLSKRDSIVPPWDSLSIKDRKEEQLLMATYAAMIDRMDKQIGRLLSKLDELDLSKNTVVIFLSDNGACPYDRNKTPNLPPGPADSYRTYDTEWANASNTPFRLYKQWVHEGGISTPMIIRWPGVIDSGKIVRKPCHVIDIMPTVIDIANTKYPKNYKGHEILPMEGKSLLPLLTGEGKLEEKPIFWELKGSRAVRSGKWKLVAERGKPWELYNLEKDRTEANNLIHRFPEKANSMREMYNRWAKRVGAPTNKKSMEMKVNTSDRYLFKKEKEK